MRELIHNQTCWVHVNRCSPKRAQRCSPTAFFALHFFLKSAYLLARGRRHFWLFFVPFLSYFSVSKCVFWSIRKQSVICSLLASRVSLKSSLKISASPRAGNMNPSTQEGSGGRSIRQCVRPWFYFLGCLF